MNLRYQKFDFNIKGGESPFFIGSALRGAFGHSLKKVCCINPVGNCDGCFADSTCLYYDFFENKNTSHGYRFAVNIPSNGWSFGFYLFGDACDKAPYAISALDSAIRSYGLGARREKMQVATVWADDKLVFDGARYELRGVNPKLFTPTVTGKISKILLRTPVRLKSDGKTVSVNDVSSVALALSAMRRLDEINGKKIASRRFEYDKSGEKKSLEFVDLERYSSRQKTKMGLGGYVGEIECGQMGEEMEAALRLGEIIGVGKSCVFGLGEIKLEEARE